MKMKNSKEIICWTGKSHKLPINTLKKETSAKSSKKKKP